MLGLWLIVQMDINGLGQALQTTRQLVKDHHSDDQNNDNRSRREPTNIHQYPRRMGFFKRFMEPFFIGFVFFIPPRIFIFIARDFGMSVSPWLNYLPLIVPPSLDSRSIRISRRSNRSSWPSRISSIPSWVRACRA